MTGEDSSGQALLKLAQERSHEGRRHLAAVTRDLFAKRRSVLSEREHALMSGTLNRLVGAVEGGLRRELAERLTHDPEVPQGLLDALAGDDGDLARPVLQDSGLLADPDLVEAVHHRVLEHQLAAAMRAAGEDPEDDADDAIDAVQSLLGSPNPEIAEATKAYLVEEARRVDSYQEPLLRPRDLEPAVAGRLARRVAAALRHHLLEGYEIAPGALDDAVEGALKALDAARDAAAAEATPAAALAEALDEADAFAPALPARVLRQGEVALFEALFARLAGLGPTRLRRVLYEPEGVALALACRALDLDETLFAALLELALRARPGREPALEATLEAALEAFDRTAPAAAREVLRYWRRDPAYLDAVERIEETREEPPPGR